MGGCVDVTVFMPPHRMGLSLSFSFMTRLITTQRSSRSEYKVTAAVYTSANTSNH
jgi:hypothetical protein